MSLSTLGLSIKCHHAECRIFLLLRRMSLCDSEYQCTECRYAECHYAECHYAESRYYECRHGASKRSSLSHKSVQYSRKVLFNLIL